MRHVMTQKKENNTTYYRENLGRDDLADLEYMAHACRRAAKKSIAEYRMAKAGRNMEDVVYLSQAEHINNMEDIMNVRLEIWRAAQHEYWCARRQSV